MAQPKIPQLGPDPSQFPPTNCALKEPGGLLAVGGDLSPERLIHAYRQGVFPWFDDNQPILWWSPNPRCVIFPNQIKISKSLKKNVRNRGFTLSFDQTFAAVINACAAPRTNSINTWITKEMKQAYQVLHQLGVAHSIEVWREEQLVGGIYGLCLGHFFFGESMFSGERDASKIALLGLIALLKPLGLEMIDCQVENPHLISLGAVGIARENFIAQLNQAFSHRLEDQLTTSIWPSSPPEKKACEKIIQAAKIF